MVGEKKGYYETPWLVRTQVLSEKGWGVPDAFGGVSAQYVCRRRLNQEYDLRRVKKLKVCVSDTPVRGAIKFRRRTENEESRRRVLTAIGHMLRGMDEAGLSVTSATNAPIWWWVEVPA